MDIESCLKIIARYRTDEVVVTTMTERLFWPSLSRSAADFCFTDPMGTGPGLAMGIALARPDIRVWLISGDGGLVMYLGSLVTIVDAYPSNMVLFLVHDNMYGLPGSPIPGAGKVDFYSMGQAAGLKNVFRLTSVEELDSIMPRIKAGLGGPTLVVMDTDWKTSREAVGGPKEYARRVTSPQATERFGRNGVRNLRSALTRIDVH